jgi:AcrR family transcriptional regulator
MAPRVGLDRGVVLRTAVEILDEQGVAGLTYSQLASRLGVRYQSLYSHVGTPQELARELHVRYLHSLGETTRAAAVGLAGRDALHAIALAHWEHGLANPGLAALHLSQDARDPALADSFRDAASALLQVLSTYGITGEELLHWRRAFAAISQGFAAFENAGVLRAKPKPRETLAMVVDALADLLEKTARQKKREAALEARSSPEPGRPRVKATRSRPASSQR